MKTINIHKPFLSGYEFSIWMQNQLVSEDGYVLDTGNYENVNAEIARRLKIQIDKHPILWNLFFRVV